MSLDFTLTLHWTCLECGWKRSVATPGFAGDGRFHYRQPGNVQCGPITAQKLGPGNSEGNPTDHAPWPSSSEPAENG